MATLYSVKCDVCKKELSSEDPAKLGAVRLQVNSEFWHACQDCWGTLRVAIVTNGKALKDSSQVIADLTSEVERLGSKVRSLTTQNQSLESTNRSYGDSDGRLRLANSELQQRMNGILDRERNVREGILSMLRHQVDFTAEVERDWPDGFWKLIRKGKEWKANIVMLAQSARDMAASVQEGWVEVPAERRRV